jgi:hypothetical protein
MSPRSAWRTPGERRAGSGPPAVPTAQRPRRAAACGRRCLPVRISGDLPTALGANVDPSRPYLRSLQVLRTNYGKTPSGEGGERGQARIGRCLPGRGGSAGPGGSQRHVRDNAFRIFFFAAATTLRVIGKTGIPPGRPAAARVARLLARLRIDTVAVITLRSMRYLEPSATRAVR